MRLSILGLLFFCSTALATEINIVNEKATHYFWRKGLNILLNDQLNPQVPQDFIPSSAKVIYSSDARNYSYLNDKKILVLGPFNEVIMTHEIGHLYLDHYLRKHSQAWKYFWIMHETGSTDIPSSIKTHQMNQRGLENYLQDLKSQNIRKGDPLFDRITTSLQETNDLLRRLENLRDDEALYKASHQTASYYHAMLPYMEVFGDALAALTLNDWNIMVPTVRKMVVDYNVSLTIPETMSFEDYISYRGFDLISDSDLYEYKEAESLSVYTQLPVFRSALRELSTNYNDKAILEALAKAILVEFEKWAQQKKLTPMTLKTKNENLIKSFQKALED